MTPSRPEPRAPILEAIRKARGHYTSAEVKRMILATHPSDCDCGKHGAHALDFFALVQRGEIREPNASGGRK